jgi:NADP-dependent 3-hydroxy acid dehydrogenase YdfG
MSHKPLHGKTAIVTGASAGIGWATATQLAAAGCNVIVEARRAERLHELVTQINAGGGEARAVAGDAGDAGHVKELVAAALAWNGHIDIAVINAGRGLAGGLMTSDQAQWEQMYRVNVMGATLLMRAAAEKMIPQKGGDIIVLGSVAGENISPFSGFYGSSKWAVWAAAEALRREICNHGVRVTTLKPGVVLSEFQSVAGYNAENFFKGIEKFGKPLDPEDIARTIEFVVAQPAHVHLNEIIIRPTGQDYP